MTTIESKFPESLNILELDQDPDFLEGFLDSALLDLQNLTPEPEDKGLNLDFLNLSPPNLDDEKYFQVDEKTGICKLQHDLIDLQDQAYSSAKNSEKAKKGLQTLKVDQSVKRFDMTKRQEAKKEKASSAGPKWFNMPATTLTEEAKRDLHIIKLRNVLDRKRFYKKDNNKALPKFFQFGTIIEHSSEFYSSRINKKDRKSTLVEEVLSDDKSRDYFKRKFNEIQEVKASGGKDYARNRFKGYKKAKGKGKGKKN